MKANELMIGDWVRVEEFDIRGTVLEIYDDKILILDEDDYDCLEFEHRLVSPIPLTREILEKSGFGYFKTDKANGITHYYLGERQFCADMNLHIGSNLKGVYWLNYLVNSVHGIHYVHELQHALRICGIEKEIVL